MREKYVKKQQKGGAPYRIRTESIKKHKYQDESAVFFTKYNSLCREQIECKSPDIKLALITYHAPSRSHFGRVYHAIYLHVTSVPLHYHGGSTY